MPDKPRQHQWVQLVMAPANVISDLEGKPMVVVSEDQWKAAEENPVTSCWACGCDVSSGYNTNCPGSMDPFPELSSEFPV